MNKPLLDKGCNNQITMNKNIHTNKKALNYRYFKGNEKTNLTNLSLIVKIDFFQKILTILPAVITISVYKTPYTPDPGRCSEKLISFSWRNHGLEPRRYHCQRSRTDPHQAELKNIKD